MNAMKMMLPALLLLTTLSPLAQAQTVTSQKTAVEVARVVEVKKLVEKPGLQVNVVVQDLGGSTDVSPTQTIYLTLYSKGEMFSTDAAFKIDDVLALKSARRVRGGMYEVVASVYDDKGFRDATYTIDARKAVTAIQAVNCGGDFDCPASTNFQSTIEVAKN